MISDSQVIPHILRRVPHGASWSPQGAGLAEPLHTSVEPRAAVAYALLSGVMVAQGRFGEAWHWLGRAEDMLQPEAEPGTGADRTGYTDLISEILDLLAQPGKPAATAGSDAGTAGRKGRPCEPLTVGETRVLRFLPSHLGAREIAGELNVSPNTVKTHLRHLYQKLGAHSRGDAVERARAAGLLASPPRSR
jgi:DNA-binding CsgD family transcriptional regulator